MTLTAPAVETAEARLNRIATRTGRGVLKTRLEALRNKHGITVTTVPSPWTSCECSGCGYTHGVRTKEVTDIGGSSGCGAWFGPEFPPTIIMAATDTDDRTADGRTRGE